MKWFLFISVVALTGQVAAGADAGTVRPDTPGGVVTLPSSGGRSEAVPGVIITLPGPAVKVAEPKIEPSKVAAAAVPWTSPASDDQPPVLRRATPVLPPAPPAGDDQPPDLRPAASAFPPAPPTSHDQPPDLRPAASVLPPSPPASHNQPPDLRPSASVLPPTPPASHDQPPDLRLAASVLPPTPPASHNQPPLPQPAAPLFPAGFDSDSALFCQAMIGVWREAEARALLGEPLRQRLAIGDNQSESGLIFAFADPSGRYKELELDFINETGVLRGVFAYPWNMTWQECRGLWGSYVLARKANLGRSFYSYLGRRLDVLVDPAGKVISLGLY